MRPQSSYFPERLSAVLYCFALTMIFAAPGASAGSGSETEKTLSPYFFVNSADEGVDALPLRETSAKVRIAGVIADVQVVQSYKNEGSKPIEAIYIFPASTRAAVNAMKMTIGERVVVAKVQERKAAQVAYEQAKSAGKSASLLEQHRPNVFQMSVANIMPGDNIKVELSYTELLVPTKGTYEFAYPTVVGPRYSNTKEGAASPAQRWIANPYLSQGTAPTYGFSFELSIVAGIPIHELTSPSHKIAVNYRDKAIADVTLPASELAGGNRDVIVRYRLQGQTIETGVQLYQGTDENFFLMMVQPPLRPVVSEVPPREYIFVVDVSGSMYGFPLNVSKALLKDLISHLRPLDKFNVILFAGVHSLLSPSSLPATSENVTSALQLIDNQSGSGGTELLPALQEALKLPHDEKASRSIVVVTDGYIDFEREAFDVIHRNLNQANVFAFGIGSSVNRHLIEGIARAGAGEPFVITSEDEAAVEALNFREYVRTPLLTRVELNYGDFAVYDVEPQSIPDLFAERPLIVFGKWRGSAQGKITLTGNQGESIYRQVIDLALVKPTSTNEALRYLWARHRIASLSDYNRAEAREASVKEITDLGLKYNLLTEYTSFLAVDETPRNLTGTTQTVKQPLPLPQGVANSAVGNMLGTTPEPETYMLLGVLSLLLIMVQARKHSFSRHC